MSLYFDLHRHTEYSTFDGFGKSDELAKYARDLGYKALGISDHGNTNGLVKHFYACKDNGIKPILGCEGYFLPKYKEQTRGYHLCLFAKDNQGYTNLNTIQYEGEKQKYYNPIWDFKLLEKYHKGLICTTACVAGYLARCIIENKLKQAEKYLLKMKEIFGDDLYIEIQPYKVTDEGLQEKVNIESIKLAKKLKIKCILTSDSHRGKKEDFSTYMKMHEIAKHSSMDIESTYKERYMPSEKDIKSRFVRMHKDDFGLDTCKKMANEMVKNLDEIVEKIDDNILDNLEHSLPKFSDEIDSFTLLKRKIKKGLKERGKLNKEYIDRVKEELEVIKFHKFEDYFLMVADYTNWAKNQGIAVGPGRGSGCNCLVNYALKITDVDPIKFDLDFRRFIRKDKKKMPDIDLDFETGRRGEVIDYLLKKYPNNSAQICSYGLYRVDNLINDLAKVCGDLSEHKEDIKSIKSLVNKYIEEGILNIDSLKESDEFKMYDKLYEHIMSHFINLYNKVRFIGTHAAGVAISGKNILEYTSIRIDSKTGKHFTNYDLNDMETINVIKFDILGLTTMSSIGELRKLTGNKEFDDDLIYDENMIDAFSKGDCDGIFQFEKKASQKLLSNIHTDSFNDVIAASAMNRPGPLSLRMPEIYANNKLNGSEDNGKPYFKYIKDTYGCVIYQEQVQAIAVNIGGLEWPEADKITKMSRGGTEKAVRNFEENYDKYLAKFEEGASHFGMNKKESFEIFDTFFNYSFNKGHATGYSLISAEEMFYKVNYPTYFWYVKLKYTSDEAKKIKFSCNAVKDGAVLFLPHVNYSSKYSLRKEDGDVIIQEGLSSIKNVGDKAAEFIENERKENGIFKSYDDFYDRCKSRAVTSRVIECLMEQGALEFKKKKYINRVVKYNSSLYSRV